MSTAKQQADKVTQAYYSMVEHELDNALVQRIGGMPSSELCAKYGEQRQCVDSSGCYHDLFTWRGEPILQTGIPNNILETGRFGIARFEDL